MLVGFTDLRCEIDRVGVGGRIVGVREACGSQEESEQERAKDFDAALYGTSPEPGAISGSVVPVWCDAITDDTASRVGTVLDARHVRL